MGGNIRFYYQQGREKCFTVLVLHFKRHISQYMSYTLRILDRVAFLSKQNLRMFLQLSGINSYHWKDFAFKMLTWS